MKLSSYKVIIATYNIARGYQRLSASQSYRLTKDLQEEPCVFSGMQWDTQAKAAYREFSRLCKLSGLNPRLMKQRAEKYAH